MWNLRKIRSILGAPALAALLLLGGSGEARADAAGDAYAVAKASFQALKSAPEEKRKFRHNWQETIDKFRAVEKKYPKSWVADDALFTIGRLYFDLYQVSRLRSDLDRAVDAFQDCEKRFPKSNYADDSLFWAAKSLHILARHEQEAVHYQAVLSRYPSGDMVAATRRQLAALAAAGEMPKVAAAPTPEPTKAGADGSAGATSGTSEPAGPRVRSGGESSEESRQVSSIRHWSNDGYTRVAIYTGGNVRWTVNELKADGDMPSRIYVDLNRAHVGHALQGSAERLDNSWEIPIGDGLLQRARVAQYDAETVRVVLDIADMEKWNVVQFDDPFRVILDVSAPAGAPVAALTEGSPKPPESETPEARAKRLAEAKTKSGLSLIEQLGLKFGKIYIDAGHGGHDPGAIGPGGLREKDVTLAIAKKLRAKVEERGYRAELTREDDTFLALEERSGIANEGKGDLFVSIHCNSHDPRYSKSPPSGVETYFANVASDKASERLAAMENATTTQKMSELQLILEGLLRGEFTVTSADLAGSVQSSVFRKVKTLNPGIRDHGVRSALFYVLLTSRMPAILVETSYISNPRDEKKLKDSDYQEALADSIADGIEKFLQDRAPAPALASPPPEKRTAAGGGQGAK